MQLQIDNSHKGTLLTILISYLGFVDIDAANQVIYMIATITTATLTCIYTVKKIKKLNDENNTKKS
jgi:hypothetical protein